MGGEDQARRPTVAFDFSEVVHDLSVERRLWVEFLKLLTKEAFALFLSDTDLV